MYRFVEAKFSSFLILSLAFSSSFVNGNYLNIEKINNKSSFYGCEKYGELLHCDIFKNSFYGNETSHNSKKIVNITREPIYINGRYDKAIEFNDKYGDYVEIPEKNIYNSPQFSISFWVKKTNGSNQASEHAQIISHTKFDAKLGWFFDTDNSHDESIRFIVTNKDGNLTMTKNISISNSSFTNIAATFDGSHIEFYKNGNLFDSKIYNGTYNSASNLPIHIGVPAYCDKCDAFKGIIDEVRLYNRSLSQDELKQLYIANGIRSVDNASLSIDRGLIGHWTFDNTLNDSSPTKNTGQMYTLLTSMVTAPDGRTFISEKNTGIIRIMENEKLLEKPFAVINDSYVDWEQGLLGLAIDPQFVNNHYVYLYYTAINIDNNPINRIVRFTDKDNIGINMTVIFDNIPATRGYHSGGAMAFGPDDKLYVTVGDATEHLYAQSKEVLVGKILRINPDGSIPKDNPFLHSPIYTLGHRNMFGIAFDYKDKIGIVTENGDILYDEINLIKKGGNYGFPTLQPANISPELSNSSIDIKPLRSYWHVIAPTQAIYYTGDRFPHLKNSFLFGTFTGHINMIHINNLSQTIDSELHIQINHSPFEPVIGITQTTNGDIYYGGFHIYKLEKVFENGIPILFPLSINHSKNIVLDNIQAGIEKYVIINFQIAGHDPVSNITSDFIKIKLPKSLIQNIKDVTANIFSSKSEISRIKIPFTLDNSSSNYNYLTIPIPLSETITQNSKH